MVETSSFFSEHLLVIVLIGIVSSFIGTLAGGGGLITLPAMMLTGIPIQTSIATNKFSSGIAAFSSVFYFINRKQLKAKAILKNLFVALAGGIGGALLTAHFSEQAMNMLALILLVIVFVITMMNKEWSESGQEAEDVVVMTKWKALLPFFIAVYDGGFGPGSSTFGILYYLKNHQNYIQAVQLTRVLILGSCTGGFIVFYQTGFFHWSYAIAMALGSVIGSQIGLLVLPRVSIKIAKVLLVTIICLLITQMFFRII
ncbi:sulfite exporter TauE/SafE family protein [Brevibacillus laterosporus]|nr:sulfite exporter TauE/SafE family protein [Brevibacillus laterosporus]MBG9801680.1 sulfite exporter tauE/safE [Brevibacillus laterosporus]MED2003035.1 sulfite exporter TauE/SafE family protein [Brevibacillus laterosporus]MED4762150.1 sulfite exporter TauE/SafE family protein [Brevibacillus laterosporus]